MTGDATYHFSELILLFSLWYFGAKFELTKKQIQITRQNIVIWETFLIDWEHWWLKTQKNLTIKNYDSKKLHEITELGDAKCEQRN